MQPWAQEHLRHWHFERMKNITKRCVIAKRAKSENGNHNDHEHEHSGIEGVEKLVSFVRAIVGSFL